MHQIQINTPRWTHMLTQCGVISMESVSRAQDAARHAEVVKACDPCPPERMEGAVKVGGMQTHRRQPRY